MGSINPDELTLEAKLNDLQVKDIARYYTNDLIDQINSFDADKIRAEAKAYKS
jgi:NitT/TauT family transport system substrate-binding protein